MSYFAASSMLANLSGALASSASTSACSCSRCSVRLSVAFGAAGTKDSSSNVGSTFSGAGDGRKTGARRSVVAGGSVRVSDTRKPRSRAILSAKPRVSSSLGASVPDLPAAASAMPGVAPNAVSTASRPKPSVMDFFSSIKRCVMLPAKDGASVSASSPSNSEPARASRSLAPPLMALPANDFSRPVAPETPPTTPPSS